MKRDWDNRVAHDYRYWMSDGVGSDDEMWSTGQRDVELLLDGISKEVVKDATILEIGCGVGRIVNALSQIAKEVIGIDVSENAISQANKLNKNANTTYVLGSGSNLQPLHPGSIDIGVSFAALGSIPAFVTAKYISELSRVVKTNGTIRLQVYFGEEQDIPQEDTLALRSYKYERFMLALEAAGFNADYCKEIILPFEVSDHNRGIVAHVIGALRNDDESQEVDVILRLLRSGEETSLGSSWKGSFDAHLVALARVNQHLELNEVELAQKALEVAMLEYPEETEEKNILKQKIEEKISAKLKSNHNDKPFGINENSITQVQTSEGRALSYKGVCLSHLIAPRKAGDAWAKRVLKDLSKDCQELLVVGLGDGHFVRALREIFHGNIFVFESDETLIKLLPEFQLTNITLIKDEKVFSNLIEESVSCISIPAVPFYNRDLVDRVKLTISSRKYADVISPRIGVVGPFAGGTLPIAGYIKRAFASMGSEVHFIDLSSYNPMFQSFAHVLQKKSKQNEMEGSFIELISNLVLNFVEEKNLDFVISVAQAPLSTTVLAELRNRGVITAHWFMEDTRRFHSWKQIAQSYDYFYVIQKGESMEEVINAGGSRVTYLPLACDPEIHRPLNLTRNDVEEFSSKISFVGAGYNNRLHVFSKFSDLEFKIWGTEWPSATPFDRLVQRSGARISVEDYIKIFNASKINLNLHSSQERDGVDPSGDFVNPRVFELAACGAFQLSDNRSLLPELFEIGEEIITFNHENEIKPLISKYVDDPESRRKVTSKARERALTEHTYAHRMKFVLNQLTRDFGEHLLSRSKTNPWQRTLKSSEKYPELKVLLENAKANKLEPTLDSLVKPIVESKDLLNEVEQKLLFMHHMKGQISQIQKLRNE